MNSEVSTGLHHIYIFILRIHVIQPVRTKRLATHRSCKGRRRGKPEVGGCRIARMAHIVVALILILEVIHLTIVGWGIVVVWVLLVLVMPEVVRFMVGHVRQRAVGGLRGNWRRGCGHDRRVRP